MVMKTFQRTKRNGRLPLTSGLSTSSIRAIYEYPANSPNRVIDFGNPGFIPLWQLAATPERQQVLQDALKTYLASYHPDLGVTGPYVGTKTINVQATPDTFGAPSDQRSFLVFANSTAAYILVSKLV